MRAPTPFLILNKTVNSTLRSYLVYRTARRGVYLYTYIFICLRVTCYHNYQIKTCDARRGIRMACLCPAQAVLPIFWIWIK